MFFGGNGKSDSKATGLNRLIKSYHSPVCEKEFFTSGGDYSSDESEEEEEEEDDELADSDSDSDSDSDYDSDDNSATVGSLLKETIYPRRLERSLAD
jgi:hypothetical protein